MTPSGYEFNSSQNELIGDLAKKMDFVAILLMIIGILGIVGAFLNLLGVIAEPEKIPLVISNLTQAIFSLLIGTWTKNAAKAFKQIVTTAGSDIENLMMALGELRKLYTLQYWLVIIGLVFLILALVLTLITALLISR